MVIVNDSQNDTKVPLDTGILGNQKLILPLDLNAVNLSLGTSRQ